jgi:hypothetical protein
VGRRLGLAAKGQWPRRPARRIGGENRVRRCGLIGARPGGQFLAGMWGETLGKWWGIRGDHLGAVCRWRGGQTMAVDDGSGKARSRGIGSLQWSPKADEVRTLVELDSYT